MQGDDLDRVSAAPRVCVALNRSCICVPFSYVQTVRNSHTNGVYINGGVQDCAVDPRQSRPLVRRPLDVGLTADSKPASSETGI